MDNKTFRKDIIEQGAQLTSKDMDKIRLNNYIQMGTRNTSKSQKKKSSDGQAGNSLEELKQKYLTTSENRNTRKLYIKNIGNIYILETQLQQVKTKNL